MDCPVCGMTAAHKAMTDGMEENYYWCWDCHIPFDQTGELLKSTINGAREVARRKKIGMYA